MSEVKTEYRRKKITGSFPATVMNCALVERAKKVQVELICVVDMHGEKTEARYYGDTDGEYANYAVEAVIKAGFKGEGWNDLKQGFNNSTFDVIPFNVSLEEITPFKGDKAGSSYLEIKFINSPDEGGPKKFDGQINPMTGTFSAAKQKIRKAPPAQQSSNQRW